MLKKAGIATLLGLSLMAGCATDLGSQSQDLATGDFTDVSEQRCFRVVGDYDGEVVPPPIDISIGGIETNAADTMIDAQAYDGPYARLLGEFVAIQVNIDAGADIDSDDIDALIRAEDMLAQADAQTALQPVFEAELVDLIAVISELNEGFRLEVPCMDTDNAGVYEVDAPLPSNEDAKRMDERIGAASDEAGASTGNGFNRPVPRPRPPHRPYR